MPSWSAGVALLETIQSIHIQQFRYTIRGLQSVQMHPKVPSRPSTLILAQYYWESVANAHVPFAYIFKGINKKCHNFQHWDTCVQLVLFYLNTSKLYNCCIHVLYWIYNCCVQVLCKYVVVWYYHILYIPWDCISCKLWLGWFLIGSSMKSPAIPAPQ